MASFKKVQEMLRLCLIEEIIVEEEFILLYEAYRRVMFLFLTRRMKSFSSRIKTQPNVNRFPSGKRYFFASLCGPFLSCVGIYIYSPEDKRKIVQIDDTSTKFRILDPLLVGNDLR